ncbi:MAG: choice-of-anchor Q domain-containing protein [Isosphaerales bacterium]
MIHPWLRELKMLSWSPRRGSRVRRDRRNWAPEGLEDRVLLASPTAYTVDLTSDTGAGSGTTGDIAYVITQANANTDPAGSLIQFDAALFNTTKLTTITLVQTLVLSETSGPEVIVGPGLRSVTIDGKGAVQALQVDTSVRATIADLVVWNGRTKSEGGGIINHGTTTVANSSISDNHAAVAGGGIYNDGTLTVTGCVVVGNTISGGGGLGLGAGIANAGSLTVTGSAVVYNSTPSYAGGIFDGINNTTVVTDSTIAGNSAGIAGGGILTLGTLTASNTTIADNTVDASAAGGGLYITKGTTVLYNTIVAANKGAGGAADDISGAPGVTVSKASAYNLIGTGGSGGLINDLNGDGNQVGVSNPGLGPLGFNGGLTFTIALLPGSPAIDKGSNSLDYGLTTDQRGAGFVRVYNGTVDIGAYELQPALVVGPSVSVGWGTQTAALQTAADGLRLLPAGRKTDLPWLNIDTLQLTLNQPVTLTAAEVTITSARGINYGPVTITRNSPVGFLDIGTTSVTIVLARPIAKVDRVTITIGSVTIATYTRRLDVLPGDVNGDGVVNSKDITTIRNGWHAKKGATPPIFGDLIGNGLVNGSDYNAAKKLLGTKLPKLAGKAMKALFVRQSSPSQVAKPARPGR